MVGDLFQPTHLLLVLVVALLVLGPKRLPEVGRTLGAGIRDFREAISGESHDAKDNHVVAASADEEPSYGTGTAVADPPATDESIDDEDLHAPAFEDDLADSVQDDAHTDPDHGDLATAVVPDTTTVSSASTPDATDDDPAATPRPAASSAGFASALAATRQHAADDSTSDDQ